MGAVSINLEEKKRERLNHHVVHVVTVKTSYHGTRARLEIRIVNTFSFKADPIYHYRPFRVI